MKSFVWGNSKGLPVPYKFLDKMVPFNGALGVRDTVRTMI